MARPRSEGSLHALMAAALALPGLLPAAPASAQENRVEGLVGHFGENARDLFGVHSRFEPLRSESLQSGVRLTFADAWIATLNYRQDTWSGATPIATAPREWRGNRSRAPDAVSGASPYLVNTNGLFLDRRTREPLRTDGFGNLVGGVDTQLVHTISGASAETRRQVDVTATRERQESALRLGGGVSDEPDYRSRFGSIGGRLDLDQKRTTVELGVSYTSSTTRSVLDHDATPYIFNACGTPTCNFFSSTSSIETRADGSKVLHGDRTDWGARLGLTRVLNQNAQLNTTLDFRHAKGYLGNAYKVVQIGFVDPEQQALAPTPDALYLTTHALLEQRPSVRNEWLWDVRYAQYVPWTDGALHAGYTFFADDWGIRAHGLKFEWVQPLPAGWTVTPAVRYYTQSAASFYTRYLVTDQGEFRTVTDPATGNTSTVPFDLSLLPAHYSSDHRLSAYGALGGGLTVTKILAHGVTLGIGAEYTRHAGGLKLGGGGEGSFADFDFYYVNAWLVVDLDARPLAQPASHTDHEHHAVHGHAGAPAPAGVMFAHVLPKAGDAMVALRFMRSRASGEMLHGATKVSDEVVKIEGCEGSACSILPSSMSMNMYMLELMYAPTNWLTLMVMPQYMDMNMRMRGVLTPAEQAALPATDSAMYLHHTQHEHTSGGLGDTGLYASFKLLDGGLHRVHATFGVTAPTGDVGIMMRDTHQVEGGFEHYHMQLGSGTWDLNPSITYLGSSDRWSWGAQLAATVRLQDRNRSGYALGDRLEATAWVGYDWQNGLSATLRGTHTREGAIRGGFQGVFHQLSPVDYPSNYGGRYWDAGIGATYAFRSGAFAGSQIGIEWIQPLHTHVNGYQLDRDYTIHATWQYMF